MNYTPIDDAYNIHHIDPKTYKVTLQYSPVCIFCSHSASTALMNDGGSFRQCNRCRKNFRARVLTDPINNFSYSTQHLRGTN